MRCGRSLDELFAVSRQSGVSKHGEISDMLKRSLVMGHGDANTLVYAFRSPQESGGAASLDDPVDTIYAGKKADLRPVHEILL